MRTIKFRGKRKDNSEWVYGSLVIREQDAHGTLGYFISTPNGEWVPIDPKTAGQFIDRLDKTGMDVYEGDILSTTSIPKPGIDYIHAAIFEISESYDSNEGYDVDGFTGFRIDGTFDYEEMYVIGNIYDNQDLLELFPTYIVEQIRSYL